MYGVTDLKCILAHWIPLSLILVQFGTWQVSVPGLSIHYPFRLRKCFFVFLFQKKFLSICLRTIIRNAIVSVWLCSAKKIPKLITKRSPSSSVSSHQTHLWTTGLMSNFTNNCFFSLLFMLDTCTKRKEEDLSWIRSVRYIYSGSFQPFPFILILLSSMWGHSTENYSSWLWSWDHNQGNHREELCKCQRCNPLSLHSSFLPGNFHIRNGACMWRLNWLADLSARGLENSFGLMVNYRYVLEDVDKNNQQYLLNGTVAASPQFLQLLWQFCVHDRLLERLMTPSCI